MLWNVSSNINACWITSRPYRERALVSGLCDILAFHLDSHLSSEVFEQQPQINHHYSPLKYTAALDICILITTVVCISMLMRPLALPSVFGFWGVFSWNCDEMEAFMQRWTYAGICKHRWRPACLFWWVLHLGSLTESELRIQSICFHGKKETGTICIKCQTVNWSTDWLLWALKPHKM